MFIKDAEIKKYKDKFDKDGKKISEADEQERYTIDDLVKDSEEKEEGDVPN